MKRPGSPVAPDILATSLRSLLAILQSVCTQIALLDRLIMTQAKETAMARHLMSVPGIGPVTAMAFVTAVEDPARFRKSRSVGAYFGLTPRRYQSGEVDASGRISKWGDPLVRTYLFEAATALLTTCKKWSALKAWGLRIAKRSGMNKSLYAKWVRVTGAVLRQSSVRLERGSPCWANAPHQHAEPGGSAFAFCPTPSPRPPG